MPSSHYHNDSVTILSKSTILPSNTLPHFSLKSLPLSASDLPMLSCFYIQKGCLFPSPPFPSSSLIPLLKHSLSLSLSFFPPLAGKLSTHPISGRVSLVSSDSGALFLHAAAPKTRLSYLLPSNSDTHVGVGGEDFSERGQDIPPAFRKFFAFDDTLSYDGHSLPLAAVQLTELADGLFIGCSVNHAVVDGTSFWNFFNTFAEITRAAGDTVNKISRPPCFSRDNVFATNAVLRFPAGKPESTFSGDEPIRERIFHFTRQAILALKNRANGSINGSINGAVTEIIGKESNDTWKGNGVNGGVTEINGKGSNDTRKGNGVNRNLTAEISSFQSLSAQLWRSVTRARNLPADKMTTFRMAINCRHRVDPKMEPLYFGNAIQSIPTVAAVGEVVGRELRWSAGMLHRSVVAHDYEKVKRGVEGWEREPRCFPLGNFDGAMITMGSSPRFPMYDNDFGWGRPVAVRSGKANKFDGKISAFPGREGDGSVDLEVVLAPATMAGLERDEEFMQYVG